MSDDLDGPRYVPVGTVTARVEPGAAKVQEVKWRPHLWQQLHEVAGGTQLLDAMQQQFGSNPIRRSDLWKLAGSVTEESAPKAHLAVVAWGTASNVRRHRPNFVRALANGQSTALVSTVQAARHGLAALWDEHFRRPVPVGLGSPSFGSKWLHAVGWDHAPIGQPKPLIYDRFVHETLTRCAGLDLEGPTGMLASVRESWLHWCNIAHDATADEHDANAADLEVAVFRHARDDGCPKAAGRAGAECLWVG